MATQIKDNFFDLLRLSYEPIEQDDKVIERAIEEFEKQCKGLINIAMDVQRNRYLLSCLPEMRAVMMDPKSRARHAQEKLRTVYEKVDQEIGWLVSAKKRSVSQAQFKGIRARHKLPAEAIQKRLGAASITVGRTEAPADLPRASSNAQRIHSTLERLNEEKGLSLVDLYEFLSHLDGSASAQSFRDRDAQALFDAVQRKSFTYTERGETTIARLCSDCEVEFKDDAARTAYDNALRLLRLETVLEILGHAQQDAGLMALLSDPTFAYAIICDIQREFPEEREAIAIYNERCARMKAPLYEPVNSDINIPCACGGHNRFAKDEDLSGKSCALCGQPLANACPGCGKILPSTLAGCPHCGANLLEAARVPVYCAYVEEAVAAWDLESAREHLQRAQKAAPSHPAVKKALQCYQAVPSDVKQFFARLQQLLRTRQFTAAGQALQAFAKTHPGIHPEKIEKQIDFTLHKANEAFGGLQALGTDAEKAQLCLSILQDVQDYEPALQWLDMHPPQAPESLFATLNESDGSCQLSWQALGEGGIRYCVLRKCGGYPKGPADGEVIAQDIVGDRYEDRTATPGRAYCYAVMAQRGRALSPIRMSGEVLVYRELQEQDFVGEAGNQKCTFSWKSISGCTGVRILRAAGRVPSGLLDGELVGMSTSDGFEDTGLANDRPVGYRLQAGYHFGGTPVWSSGLTCMLTPCHKPLPVTIRVSHEDKEYRAVWSNDQSGFLVRLYLAEGLRVPSPGVHPVVSLESQWNLSPLTQNINIRDGQAVFTLQQNGWFVVVPVVLYGAQALVGSGAPVQRMEPIEVDKRASVVKDRGVTLSFGDWPQGAESICVVVRHTPEGEPADFPSSPEDIAWKTLKLTRAELQRRGNAVTFESLEHGNYFISIFTGYVQERHTHYTEPVCLRRSLHSPAKLAYEVVWGSGFTRKAKRSQATLRLAFTPAPFYTEMPALGLYRSKGAGVNLQKPEDGECVLEIKAQECEGKDICHFSHKLSLPQGLTNHKLRLFVRDGDASRVLLEHTGSVTTGLLIP